ncbi:uncharacterized protein LOC144050369 isoform X1 [Vanacampus margaritifer]
MCAKKTAQYKEELCGVEDIKPQRHMLDELCKLEPRVVLHRTDPSEEYFHPEWQEVKIKEETETSHIKEEEQEDEITEFPLTGVSVESEGGDGDHCGGSQTHDGLIPPLSDRDHIMSSDTDDDDDDDDDDEHSKDPSEEYFHPEWQEVKIKEETSHIKEEEQEDEITKFPLTGVSVESEEGDGDHCGRSQTDDGLIPPLSDRDQITSSDTDDDDDDDDDDEHSKDVSEDLCPEPQEPEPPHVKKEEQEDAIATFPLTGVRVKSEKGDGEQRGGSQADSLITPLSDRQGIMSSDTDGDDDEHSEVVNQEDLHPELLESRQIKEEEEPEPLRVKEEQWEEEISTFQLTVDGVKCEEVDGDHCGGSQTNGPVAPLSDCDCVTPHSSETQDVGEKDDEHSTDPSADDVGPEEQRSDLTQITKTESKPPHNKEELCDDEISVTLKSDDDDGDGDDVTSHSSETDSADEKDGEYSTGDVTHHADNKRVPCCQCDKTFVSELSLKTHTRIHAGGKTFACSICKKTFMRNSELTRHTRIHTGEKPFACSLCEKRFSCKGHLTQHLKTHTGEKPFACSVCEKRFSRKVHLREHLNTHTGEKPFTCSICEKRFSRKGRLKEHLKTHTKPFSCLLCVGRFSSEAHLNRHIRTHTGGKMFDCLVCGKTFTLKSSLKIHKRIHNGEKPYPCLACAKSFTQKVHLTLHTTTHTGEKPFPCSFCGKRFPAKWNLKIHLKTHPGEKQYACLVSDEKLLVKAKLNTHKRKHTIEKPFACSVCDNRFSSKTHLNTHTKVHIGEKPFACSVCDKSYSLKKSLKRHTRRHTVENPLAAQFVEKDFH